MNEQDANAKTITRLMFRLLPIQILLQAVNAINAMVSSFFASNFVGVDAMSAVGLFNPINMFCSSAGLILVGGSVILCGKYMGQNQKEEMQGMFSLNLMLSLLTGLLFTLILLALSLFDLTGFMTRDQEVRPLFNLYLLGKTIGMIPMMLSSSLASFLSLENKTRQTTIASVIYLAANIVLNYLFVQVLHMEAFGLAVSASLGMWIFFAAELLPYLRKKTLLRFKIQKPRWGETFLLCKTGLPGAATNCFQTFRGYIVNRLLEVFVGSVGISAFAASDSLMCIFWTVPSGMMAVSRMMFSVSIGEEDRQSLTDVMRVMFRRYLPLMGAICAMIILCAEPMTRLFFRDPTEPVYRMTVWGLRILPLCMPFSVICMHFTSYGQSMGETGLIYPLSVLDGVVCVAGFTALMIRSLGMNSVYFANVFNGVVTVAFIFCYACVKKKRFPRCMEDLMTIPDRFGIPQNDRMDLSILSMEDVVSVAERVQIFCRERGVDERRSFLAGLSMEEMAGNIVDHGFTKDKKKHSIDVRVAYKDGDVILRIKDDCIPFNPRERLQMADGDDPAKNIGIRMVFKMSRDVQYQNILGLNVLTIRI